MTPAEFSLFVMLDDNDNELLLTQSIFKSHFPHIEFVCERSPQNALDLISARVHAGLNAFRIALLLDINMPKLNGFEIVFAVRNNVETFRTCVLMLSASRQTSDRDDAAAIGANGYVQKPFTIPKLETALAQISPDEPSPMLPDDLVMPIVNSTTRRFF